MKNAQRYPCPRLQVFSYFPQIFPRFSQIFPVAGFLGCPRRERTTGSPSLFKNNLYTVVFPCPPLQVEHFFQFHSILIAYLFSLFAFSFFVFPFFCSFIRLNRGVHDRKGQQKATRRVMFPVTFFLFNTRGWGRLDIQIVPVFGTSQHQRKCSQVINHKKKKKLHISCLLMKV